MDICDIDKLKASLNESIFKNSNEMLSPEINSCIYHNLTHRDTEILGMFCDHTNVHGEELKNILLEGYIRTIERKRKSKSKIC